MLHFINPGVPIHLLGYCVCPRPQPPYLTLLTDLPSKPHGPLGTPDRNRARAARFSILRTKRPAPLDLATPASYCHKHHPTPTPLVSPRDTTNRLQPSANIEPTGLDIRFFGLIPPRCSISPHPAPTVTNTTP